jgi:AcrR family transcriptional regulator
MHMMSDLAQRLMLAVAAGPSEPEDEIAVTVLDAALRQFELVGIAKSSVEDIAKRAKVARVTVYRRFHGKDALVEAVILRELHRFQRELSAAVAPYEDPEDQLVEGFAFTIHASRNHRLLQRLHETEPDELVPHLTTNGAAFLEIGRTYLAARMASELDDGRSYDELVVAADIASRLVISYAITPGAPINLDDPNVAREFARTYLVRILEDDSAR